MGGGGGGVWRRGGDACLSYITVTYVTQFVLELLFGRGYNN